MLIIMQINKENSLYKTSFTANILISGQKGLLNSKQISELASIVRPLGKKNDIIEFNLRSNVMDMVEVDEKHRPKKFLSGFKMFVKTTIHGVHDTDLSVAKKQQEFWERYEDLSPFGVIKSWINSVKKDISFDIKEINDKPRLYNASNVRWNNNSTFFVRAKKIPKEHFKADIYKFQDLWFSKADMERDYKKLIEQAKRDKEKNILPEDVITSVINNNANVKAEQLKNLLNEADNYKIKMKSVKTQSLYSDSKGHYNTVRTAIHNKILDEIFINSDKAKPSSGNKPTFIMLGGRGGSGKTKFGKDGKTNVYNKNSYIVLNSDEIKKKLPEYVGFNDGELHEESIDIINKAFEIAKQKGLNIVLDSTMSHIEYCEPILKGFSDAGYNIEMYFMYLPREKAAERALLRFNYNKRFIPLNVLLNMTDNEINFDILKKYASKYGFYSNDVKIGTDPILIDFGVPDLFQEIYKKCKFY